MSEGERGSRTAAWGYCSHGRNAFSRAAVCRYLARRAGKWQFASACLRQAVPTGPVNRGQNGGIVEKQDDPVEFAFASATRESKPEGMEEIAATNLESLFKVSHNVLEPVGVERLRVEKEESELADDVAGGVTSEDRVGIRRPHDARGVIGKDQLKQISEADEVVGMVAEKRGGTFAPGELPRSRISR